MNQQRVPDAAPQCFSRKAIVESRSIPKMIQIVILVAGSVGVGIMRKPRAQSPINIPVRSVYGDIAHAITVLTKKGAHFVSPLDRVAFFEGRETESLCESGQVLNQRLDAEDILGKLFKAVIRVEPM